MKKTNGTSKNRLDSTSSSYSHGTLHSTASISRISEGSRPLYPPRSTKYLRYHDNVGNTITSGALSTYVFAANALYDPDVTGTGHQPMGFDQLMLAYVHYAVKKARISILAQNTSSGSVHSGLRIDSAAAPITGSNELVENGAITYDVLEAKNTIGSAKSYSIDVDVCKFLGIPSKDLTSQINLAGQINANPAELVYFHVMSWDPNGLSGGVTLDVTIDFEVIFFEPREQPLSLVSVLKRAILAEMKHSP